MKYGLKFINERKIFKECLSLKLNNKKENKIFSKQFVTTEPTKYGLKFSVLSIIIFTNPSARAGYDTRSIFKRSLTGLNSEFSFS